MESSYKIETANINTINDIFKKIYLKKEELCGNDVGGSLVDNLDTNHILYYIESDKGIEGFAIIQQLPPDTYFLDTICTLKGKGYGTSMMNFVISDLKTNGTMEKLELSAATPDLNNFYNKFNPSSVKKSRDPENGDDFTYLLK